MQTFLVVVPLDELLDVEMKALQILVLVGVVYLPLVRLEEAAQLALSYGFTGWIMIGTNTCCLMKEFTKHTLDKYSEPWDKHIAQSFRNLQI
jgi:hypothetical protein